MVTYALRVSTNSTSVFNLPGADLSSTRPQPTTWDDYVNWLMPEWKKLLASDPLEAKVHRFLEENPSLVPSFYGIGDAHHAIQGSALFSEIPLTGIGSRRPDFMWIHANTLEIQPVFIEIERPGKKFFKPLKGGDPSKAEFTRDFLQAKQQITDWQRWWEKEVNSLLFKDLYLKPYVSVMRHVEPRYILIYGTQAELDQVPGDPTLRDMVRHEQAKTGRTRFRTYDGLKPEQAFSDFPSIHHSDTHRITLKGVPASLTTGPLMGPLYARIPNPPVNLFNNSLWDGKRSSYVLDRWRHWANSHKSSSGPLKSTRSASMGE